MDGRRQGIIILIVVEEKITVIRSHYNDVRCLKITCVLKFYNEL